MEVYNAASHNDDATTDVEDESIDHHTHIVNTLAENGIDYDDPQCECGSECTHVVTQIELGYNDVWTYCDDCCPDETVLTQVIPREHVRLQWTTVGGGHLRVYDGRTQSPVRGTL